MSNSIYRSPYGDLYLCHGRYKYIKREWKNGNWHYTYPLTKEVEFNKKIAKDYSEAASDSYDTNKKYETFWGHKSENRTREYNRYVRNTRQYRDEARRIEASQASLYRDVVKKWESTPISKLQTAYHKAADSVKKTLSKWKNALVSAFTPKEKVKINTSTFERKHQSTNKQSNAPSIPKSSTYNSPTTPLFTRTKILKDTKTKLEPLPGYKKKG